MIYAEFHKEVYDKDNPRTESCGWLQWKGTNVCIDLHCVCGHHGHIDGDFFYFYECVGCGRKFAMGCNVKMIELNQEQVEFLDKDSAPLGFWKDDQHD